jgi:hypothetical protein
MKTPGPGDYLDVATRVWQEPLTAASGKPPVMTSRIQRILAVSITTADDTGQRLLSGAGVLGTVTVDGRFVPDDGGTVVFHDDDLPESDPAAFAELENAAIAADCYCLTASEFVRQWVRWFCVPRRNPWGTISGEATLVVFDAPFVLSRLAVKTGARWTANHGGGFTLDLVPMYECKSGLKLDKLMPRVRVKHETAAYSQVDFQKYEPPGDSWRIYGDEWRDLAQRRVLDLRSLVSGLSGDLATFGRACRDYGVCPPESAVPCVADAHAAGELAARTLAEFYDLPLNGDGGYVQSPCRIWSSATIAKAAYRSMGIVPPMERVNWDHTAELMGIAMQAYYGARVETKIRCTPVPVAVCDFSALYPSVSALMGVWEFVAAERLTAADATAEAQAFLDQVTEAKLLDKATWRELTAFGLIEPDGSGVLPVRARYGDSDEYTVGLNHYQGAGPQWYTLSDVAASVLLTGHVPAVIKAVRLVPHGKLTGLRPLRFGQTVIDPESPDFWTSVVKMRKQMGCGHADSCACAECRGARFLKLLANSGCYGAFAEIDREDTDRAGTRVLHDGQHRREVRSPINEKPGKFCYPPLASIVTGAGRLMLALLEHMVTDAGGTWATGDTDSLHIVADVAGGPVSCPTPDGTDTVTALSFAAVDRIRKRINALNPYDSDVVPDLLKREVPAETETTWCFAISPKRYALWRLVNGRPVALPELDGKEAVKQHGFGMYASPDGSSPEQWITEAWQFILDKHYGLNPQWPAWADAHAVSKFQVTTPQMLRLFDTYNATVSVHDQIRPFTKIIVAIAGETAGIDDDDIGPALQSAKFIAPANLDPDQLSGPVWINRENPSELVCLPDPSTMRQVLLAHMRRRDPKLTGPRTGLQERRLIGVLGGRLHMIGKEASDLDTAIVFRDSQAKTSFWPSARSDDALLAFAGLTAAEIASRVNDESKAIVAMINRERNRQLNQGGNLRSKARRAELAGAAEQAERDVTGTYGQPVTVSDRTIRRWRSGEPVDHDTFKAIQRTAARHVAGYLNIRPDGIREDQPNVRAGRYTPETVLSLWRDNPAREQPRCRCGCGYPLIGSRQRYATPACRQRTRRAQPSTPAPPATPPDSNRQAGRCTTSTAWPEPAASTAQLSQ